MTLHQSEIDQDRDPPTDRRRLATMLATHDLDAVLAAALAPRERLRHQIEEQRLTSLDRSRVECRPSFVSRLARLMMDAAQHRAAIVGGGPAGLIAADVLSRHGIAVTVFEAMPSVGRKLLVAGGGGLNLTHSEPLAQFISRYGAAAERFADMLRDFGPPQLREFVARLGIDTLVGSSGRVFPTDMRAAPLLRAWIRDLRERGVDFQTRHRLVDLGPGPRLTFRRTQPTDGAVATSPLEIRPEVAILALGGASWRRLGSDGLWSRLLTEHGVTIRRFEASNCGFEVGWSPIFKARCEGLPLKNLRVRMESRDPVAGELLITRYGLEGGPLYALSSQLRAAIAASGSASIEIDLKPSLTAEALAARLAESREKRTLSEHLRRKTSLDRCALQLLRETTPAEILNDPQRAARRIKAVPLTLKGIRPLDEAISSAGGVPFSEVDLGLMLRALPGFFLAGEMLDYDPPTGGYLLQAAFTTGVRAAYGALAIMGISRLGS